MITTIKHNNITWVNIESPTSKEIAEIAENFNIHPLIAEELASPTVRSKVDVYNDSLYLILHFPIYDPVNQTSMSREVDFVIGKDYLITSEYFCFEPLKEFIKEFQNQEILRNKYFNKHPGFLVFYIIKELYEFSLRQLDHIHIKINRIEEHIFNGEEKKMVKNISLIKRDILDFRRAIYSHDTVLKSFEDHGKEIFGQSFTPYLDALSGELAKVKNITESNKETIEALQETNESLLSNKTSETMKTLTILAFITFPLTLFSNIFSMNAVFMPIIGHPFDFWIIVGVMAVATIGMLFFFKKRKPEKKTDYCRRKRV